MWMIVELKKREKKKLKKFCSIVLFASVHIHDGTEWMMQVCTLRNSTHSLTRHTRRSLLTRLSWVTLGCKNNRFLMKKHNITLLSE